MIANFEHETQEEAQRIRHKKRRNKRSPSQMKNTLNEALEHTRTRENTTLFDITDPKKEAAEIDTQITNILKTRDIENRLASILERHQINKTNKLNGKKKKKEESWTDYVKETKSRKSPAAKYQQQNNNKKWSEGKKKKRMYNRTTENTTDRHRSPTMGEKKLEKRFHIKEKHHSPPTHFKIKTPSRQTPTRQTPTRQTPEKQTSNKQTPLQTKNIQHVNTTPLNEKEMEMMENILGKQLRNSEDIAAPLKMELMEKQLEDMKRELEKEKLEKKRLKRRLKRSHSIISQSSSSDVSVATSVTSSSTPDTVKGRPPKLKLNIQPRRIQEIKEMTIESIGGEIPMSPKAEFQIRHMDGYESVIKTIDDLFPDTQSDMTMDQLLSLQPSLKKRAERYFPHSTKQRKKKHPSHIQNYKHPLSPHTPTSPARPFDSVVATTPTSLGSPSSWFESSLAIGAETPAQYVAHRVNNNSPSTPTTNLPMTPTTSPSFINTNRKISGGMEYVGTPTTPSRSSPLISSSPQFTSVPHQKGYVHAGYFQTDFKQHNDSSSKFQQTGIYRHANARWEASLRSSSPL